MGHREAQVAYHLEHDSFQYRVLKGVSPEAYADPCHCRSREDHVAELDDVADQQVADLDHSMDLVVVHMVGPVDSNQHQARKGAYPDHCLDHHLVVDTAVLKGDVSPEEDETAEEVDVQFNWLKSARTNQVSAPQPFESHTRPKPCFIFLGFFLQVTITAFRSNSARCGDL